MKKILPVLLLSMLMVSCYREIIIPVGDDEPIAIMNAQLNTGETTHEIRLSVTQNHRAQPLNGADVRVTVNGKTTFTATEVPDDPEVQTYLWDRPYAFEANLEPGDEVLVEARKDAFYLTATVTAPPAIDISLIDTSTVRMSFMGDTEEFLQVKVSFRDLPGDSWYRVDACMETDFAYLDGDGNPSPEYSGTVISWITPETGYDPIVSEGGGKTGGMDMAAWLGNDWSYHCFSDNLFRDKECTIRPLFYPYSFRGDIYGYVYPSWFGRDAWDIIGSMPMQRHQKALLQVRTIDFSQYHYLKALQNLDTYGTEMTFLVEPTTLPSNVEGGLGFVGLETVSDVLFFEMEDVLPALNDQLYY